MQISVIIATYNRLRLLTRTLPSVIKQDLPKEDYEILVAVDGSSDGTREYLRALPPGGNVRVLEQPHRGQAAAINAALKAAIGKIVLFLDDDILCTPTLLRAHVAAHKRSPHNLVYGPVLLAPKYHKGWLANGPRASVTISLQVLPQRTKKTAGIGAWLAQTHRLIGPCCWLAAA